MMLSLRPVEPADEPFLFMVYASTREPELAMVDWDPAQKEAFLLQQFSAQYQYYREHYVGASYQVILRDGLPVGRLYVARWPEEIRIMDIALLPEHRNAGIGSSLLRDLQADGAATGKRVSIHVEKFNPALRLYERLGFAPTTDRGVYVMLEWRPTSGDETVSAVRVSAGERPLGEMS